MRAGDIPVFSPEEVRALVRAAAPELDEAIYLTAAFTGLRLGELLALTWRDVDFAGSVVRVRASYAAGVLTTPKVGKVRAVPMVPDVALVLAQWVGVRTGWRTTTSCSPARPVAIWTARFSPALRGGRAPARCTPPPGRVSPYNPSRSAGTRKCPSNSPAPVIRHTSTRLRLRSKPTCKISDPPPSRRQAGSAPGTAYRQARSSFAFASPAPRPLPRAPDLAFDGGPTSCPSPTPLHESPRSITVNGRYAPIRWSRPGMRLDTPFTNHELSRGPVRPLAGLLLGAATPGTGKHRVVTAGPILRGCWAAVGDNPDERLPSAPYGIPTL